MVAYRFSPITVSWAAEESPSLMGSDGGGYVYAGGVSSGRGSTLGGGRSSCLEFTVPRYRVSAIVLPAQS
jgi:hypothetical protein